jgi:hypothetical protein
MWVAWGEPRCERTLRGEEAATATFLDGVNEHLVAQHRRSTVQNPAGGDRQRSLGTGLVGRLFEHRRGERAIDVPFGNIPRGSGGRKDVDLMVSRARRP